MEKLKRSFKILCLIKNKNQSPWLPIAPISPPTGEERGNGNSGEEHGWHCGTGSQGMDRPLPPGKKQTPPKAEAFPFWLTRSSLPPNSIE